MINVIASIHIKEGRLSEYIDILKSNISNVLGEKGCIEYSATIDVHSGLPAQELIDNVVTIIEKWDSLDDLHAHLSASHMIVYKERVSSLVDKISLKILKDV